MVAEAHGGSWGAAAKETFKAIGREYANQVGVTNSQAASELAQRISITLVRENARAVLRRLASADEPRSSTNAAAWEEDIDDPPEDVVMSFQ